MIVKIAWPLWRCDRRLMTAVINLRLLWQDYRLDKRESGLSGEMRRRYLDFDALRDARPLPGHDMKCFVLGRLMSAKLSEIAIL